MYGKNLMNKVTPMHRIIFDFGIEVKTPMYVPVVREPTPRQIERIKKLAIKAKIDNPDVVCNDSEWDSSEYDEECANHQIDALIEIIYNIVCKIELDVTWWTNDMFPDDECSGRKGKSDRFLPCTMIRVDTP